MRLTYCVAAGGLLLALLLLRAADAAPLNHAFSVTATSGPLAGVTASGTFSYDSSTVVPGGENLHTGLLTALDFTWNGILYDETTANTGGLFFDAAGDLIRALFGTNCSTGLCSVFFGMEEWAVSAPGPFAYAMPGSTSVFDGTARLVPEPSALSLLGIAVAGLVLLQGRRAGERAH
jgi:hypothetical protein